MLEQRGFTLVELIMVIVLLGIVATISTQFVALSTRGAIDLGDRQQRALQGVVISEQVTRELREAHPLSVRVRTDDDQQCIEWIPIQGATAYDRVPFEEASDEALILPFSSDVTNRIKNNPSRFRLAVYGYSAANSFYNDTVDPAPISPQISSVEDNGAVGDGKIVLEASHRFESRSPQKRLYLIGGAVSICQNGSRLYRFEDYGLIASQPSFSDFDSSATRGIMATNLESESFRVEFIPPSLRRFAIVNFAFVLKTRNSDETTRVSQEAQIRNVP